MKHRHVVARKGRVTSSCKVLTVHKMLLSTNAPEAALGDIHHDALQRLSACRISQVSNVRLAVHHVETGIRRQRMARTAPWLTDLAPALQRAASRATD